MRPSGGLHFSALSTRLPIARSSASGSPRTSVGRKSSSYRSPGARPAARVARAPGCAPLRAGDARPLAHADDLETRADRARCLERDARRREDCGRLSHDRKQGRERRQQFQLGSAGDVECRNPKLDTNADVLEALFTRKIWKATPGISVRREAALRAGHSVRAFARLPQPYRSRIQTSIRCRATRSIPRLRASFTMRLFRRKARRQRIFAQCAARNSAR